MEENKQVLIIDDDKILGNSLRSALSDAGYRVLAVDRASVAMEEMKKQIFNVVLLDLVLPDLGGIELLHMFSKKYPETCFIIFTGHASLSSAIEALKVGAYDYIMKPFDVDYLKLVIKRGIEKQGLIIKNKELFGHLEKEKYKLEIVLEAYNKISNILELDDLADFVTAYAIKIAEAEKASLMVVDEASGELVLKGSKGLDKEKITWRIKIGELIAGWVAQEGEALLVRDIDSDPRLRRFAKRSRYRTKSFISLPLKADSRVIGVMNVTDKLADINIFTEDDLRYLTLLAHQTVAQIENIRLCEKLSSLAITDALTNIFNHRYFQEELNSEIMRAQRYKHPLSLVMFDIDSFKKYNDRYGHLEGDKALKQIAAIMKQNARKVDKICRYGGEEFMIILPDTDLEGAKVVAEKIRKAICEMDLLIKLTLSGGVATYRQGLSKSEFVSWVDQALYRSKAAGKNRICIFE